MNIKFMQLKLISNITYYFNTGKNIGAGLATVGLAYIGNIFSVSSCFGVYYLNKNIFYTFNTKYLVILALTTGHITFTFLNKSIKNIFYTFTIKIIKLI